MIFAVAASVRSSLAARLDMSIPGYSIAEVDIPTIRRELLLRYCNTGYRFMDAGYRGHKKASRGCPGSPFASCWGLDQDTRQVTTPASGRRRPHGSRRSTG